MQNKTMQLDFLVMGYVCLGTALAAGYILAAAGVPLLVKAGAGAAICWAFVSTWNWRWGV